MRSTARDTTVTARRGQGEQALGNLIILASCVAGHASCVHGGDMADGPAERNVLIVSSNPLIRPMFHDVLFSEDWTPLLAADGVEAIGMYRGWRPSVVLTDFNLPDMTGLELLRQQDADAVGVILCGGAYQRHGSVVGFFEPGGCPDRRP